MVLYRKFRPASFSAVKEQSVITDILRAAITQQTIAHAYLFTGTRGTGKTTTARIFAKAVNCEQVTDGEPCNVCQSCLSFQNNTNVDFIEIDAASNRGIDDIREIKEKINFAPTMSKYKVYIIDEVHMLTKDAFNALLKTLEEPPAHVLFILATTEVYKVPLTVLSRCQRFDFKNASLSELQSLLEDICKSEKVTISKDALQLVSELAEGSFRDGLSILEKLRSTKGEITYEKALAILGIPDRKVITSMISSIKLGNIEKTVQSFHKAYQEGMDVYQFNKNFLKYLEKSLLDTIGAPTQEGNLSMGDIMKFIRELLKAEESLKFTMVPALIMETTLIELCYTFSTTPPQKMVKSTIPVSGEKAATESKIPKNFLQSVPNKAEVTLDEKQIEKVSVSTRVASAPFSETTKIVEVSLLEPSVPLHITPEELRSLWAEVILKVIPYNHHLGSFFSQAKPMEIQGNALIVEVKYSFHKDRIEDSKSREAIAKVLTEVYGIPLIPRCVVNTKLEIQKSNGLIPEQKNIIEKKEEIEDNKVNFTQTPSHVSSDLDLLEEALRIFELE